MTTKQPRKKFAVLSVSRERQIPPHREVTTVEMPEDVARMQAEGWQIVSCQMSREIKPGQFK